MHGLIKLISGVIAASAAFAVGEVTHLVGVESLPGRFGLFLVAYVIVAIIAERAMRTYGTKK